MSVERTGTRAIRVTRAASRLLPLLLPALLLAVAAGCSPQGDGGPESAVTADSAADPTATPADGPSTPADSPATPERAALPALFRIMAGLEEDMAGVDAALWQGDLDAVADAAQAVADHPKIPPEEAATIAETLGPAMEAFKAYDGEVHDLATRLAEEARAGDMASVLVTGAELREGCVACHAAFRDRLRSGLR